MSNDKWKIIGFLVVMSAWIWSLPASRFCTEQSLVIRQQSY